MLCTFQTLISKFSGKVKSISISNFLDFFQKIWKKKKEEIFDNSKFKKRRLCTDIDIEQIS